MHDRNTTPPTHHTDKYIRVDKDTYQRILKEAARQDRTIRAAMRRIFLRTPSEEGEDD